MAIVHLPESTHEQLRLLAFQRKKRIGKLAAEIIDGEIKRNQTRQKSNGKKP